MNNQNMVHSLPAPNRYQCFRAFRRHNTSWWTRCHWHNIHTLGTRAVLAWYATWPHPFWGKSHIIVALCHDLKAADYAQNCICKLNTKRIDGFHSIFSLWQLEGKGSCDVDIDQW